MPRNSLSEWKDFIQKRPDAHVLQAAEWGELKSSFGWDAVRLVCEDLGAQILFRQLPLGLTVAYLPKPAFNVRAAASRSQFWRELASACRAQRAIFLKIEPDECEPVETEAGPVQSSPGDYGGLALRRSAHNIQPPRTLVVDLRGSEDDILGSMKQKCRYNIRLAQKKGVTVRPWNDIEGFHGLMQITGGRDGFAVHSAEYYRRAYELFRAAGNCEMLVAEYDRLPLGALMVFRHGSRAWFLYGASNDEERNRMPTYLLQWEAMRWAKAQGCTEYDLWGVPDENEEVLEANFEARHDGLWGVYRFKRGFGGQLRRAAQALDVVFNPLLYRLYLWRMAGREGE